jgi:hypothetical protein
MNPAEPALPLLFRISPLIRITLLLLYFSLTFPLPFLAQVTAAPVPAWVLAIGLALGGLLLYGALSEQVVVTDTTIQVTYPTWIRWLLRRGWSLAWSEVVSLKPRFTGQGGIVYYFLSDAGQAYLLPMRMAGFARFVKLVEQKTSIDTTDVKPLAQPWMYFILLVITLSLLLGDFWIVWTAKTLIL